MSHKCVVDLFIGNLREAVLVNVLRVLDEASLVAVPGHVAPIGLVIFEEDSIVFEILSHSEQNLILSNTGVAF